MSIGVSSTSVIGFDDEPPDPLRHLFKFIEWPDSISYCDYDFSTLSTKRQVKFGTKYFAGEFYSPKNNRIVQHETGLERAFYLKLEKSLLVRSYAVQPMTFPYNNGENLYFPDVLIQLNDNRVVVAELKPVTFMRSYKNQTRFAALINLCRAAGFGWFLTDGVFASTELGGYQIPPNLREVLKELLSYGRINEGQLLHLKEEMGATERDLKALVYQFDLMEPMNPRRLVVKEQNSKPIVPHMWRNNRPY